MGYVHNDIKPENILLDQENRQRSFLIDFGLVSKFVNPEGNHRQERKRDFFTGNVYYASQNQIKCKTRSRRDDIQSVLHMFISFLHNDTLPWHDAGKNVSDLLDDRVKNEAKYAERLNEMTPPPVRALFKQVWEMKFSEKPDYDRLI